MGYSGMDVNCSSTWDSVHPNGLIDLLIDLRWGEFTSLIWVLPGKLEVPGPRWLVPAGLLHIVAASQEKKLLVHAVYKENLSPAMGWGSLPCKENYA